MCGKKKIVTSYLCIGIREITSLSLKLFNFAQPLLPSVLNTMINLSEVSAALTFLSQVSYRDILSVKVLLRLPRAWLSRKHPPRHSKADPDVSHMLPIPS